MQVNTHFTPIVMSDLNKPWERIEQLGTPVFFPARTIITGRSPGVDKESGMYYIKKGRVRLSHITAHGQEKMLLYMGPGTLFNEMPMIKVVSDYMFTCLEPTNAIFWTRECLSIEFVRQYPDLILNLMETMSTKMYSFNLQICGLSSYGTFANVCRVLFSMFLFQQVQGRVVPGLSKQELAAFLGIHRSSLHKALARLRSEGVIGLYTKNSLQILNSERLRGYAGRIDPSD